jgi:hypothetical protein
MSAIFPWLVGRGDLRVLRLAARTVVEAYAGKVAKRSPQLSLADACTALGIDVDVVVARAEELARP